MEMPESLTAENGAKAALMGEFFVIATVSCGCLYDERCPDCHGEGTYAQKIQVPWTTIKEIYAKAVDHFAHRQFEFLMKQQQRQAAGEKIK